MSRNPFQIALSLSVFGSLFIVLALAGCRLGKDHYSIVVCRWSDTPWWGDVWVGVGLLTVSLFFWRRAIRSVPA